MKTRNLALVAALALLVPVVAFGATFRGGNTPNVGSSETINDDLYIAGTNVSVSGQVVGDLFAAGQSILVSNQVRQDLFAAGNNVTVTGDVGDDVKAAGSTVLIQGAVGSDAMVAGNQVSLSGRVNGDLLAAGNTIDVEAPVQGKVHISGQKVFINSAIGKDIKVEANELELGPKAVINGNLTYKSPKELIKADGAKIIGAVSYEPTTIRAGKTAKAFFSFWILMKALMLAVLAFLVGLLFKRYSNKVVELTVGSPWSSLGKGIVTVIVLPIISIILLFTVIGIPLGILGIVAVVALSIVGFALAPIILGSVLYKWIARAGEYKVNWKTILLGVVVFVILGWIPFVGCIIGALLFLAAVGAVISLKRQIAKEWR